VLAPAVAVAAVLAAWQLSGLRLNPILISTPAEVATELVSMVRGGAILAPLGESLLELVIGGVAGIVVGVALGVLMGRYRLAETVLGPFVNFFNATPLVVTIPLVIIWVGIGQQARLLFVFLITLWPILLNTVAGIRNVGLGHTEVGTAFGLSEGQVLRRITIPGAAPYILAGARVSAGLAIIGMIVSEMEGQPDRPRQPAHHVRQLVPDRQAPGGGLRRLDVRSGQRRAPAVGPANVLPLDRGGGGGAVVRGRRGPGVAGIGEVALVTFGGFR
jgi:ABC-type nitrate/sulfonate/bicarbonate transport system permease component